MSTVNIGLLGCGTVGAGVLELIDRRMGKIADMTGKRPVVKRVLVQDIEKPRVVSVEREKLTTDPLKVLEDADVSIVVECIGGIEPARSYILSALKSGKHVVTANKDLMALHGPEILKAAHTAGVTLMYEAAVGGAIPLVRPLKECLTANEITDLKGIVNGTTNYILTMMTTEGLDFNEALVAAQTMGYAEADPSSDVDGLDAARKLVILAALAFHANVKLEEVKVQGIRTISEADVRYANELGSVIKLIAEGTDRDGRLVLTVRPSLVPKHHPLAHVSHAYNALYVHGDAAGDLMFYGPGAGSLPTASAVVGDLIEVLRFLQCGAREALQHLVMNHKIVDASQGQSYRHYFRMNVSDEPGVFAKIAAIFGDASVSMETVLQKRLAEQTAEIVIVTHAVSGRKIEEVVNRLRRLPNVREVCNVLPVLAHG